MKLFISSLYLLNMFIFNAFYYAFFSIYKSKQVMHNFYLQYLYNTYISHLVINQILSNVKFYKI